MGGYRVDPGVLGDVDAALVAAAEQARAELHGLASAAQPLLEGWHGVGGAHFRQGWDDWHAGAVDLLAALAQLAEALGMSGQEYATTDDAVRTSVAAVPS
ncbi:WXG100 family type VII secretion target [uncultured Jatrophihabitans sp.]|uniref:WXG100 family type VII secretion target n=1 Tax=uncultured Jatrophihabitans sp. TaxID=1610747 RepID=UPI0035CB4571